MNNAHVRAGTVLGFVGNTGDAEGTPYHLHFEIHPVALLGMGYDGVIDPTPVLERWKHVQDVRFAEEQSVAHLDDAAHRPIAIVPEIEDLRCYYHAVQILNRTDRDRRGAHAVDGRLAGRKGHVFRDFDPLPDAVFVRNHEKTRAANLKLPHNREMRAP